MDTSRVRNLLSHNGNSKTQGFGGFFGLFRAPPMAYGGSPARGRVGAVATSLHYSHSNASSQLSLQPTPQLTATPDP